MMNIVFVILHYMAIKDTMECVESIRKHIDIIDYKIVIVDNASPNNTGKQLIEEYKMQPDIVVLCNEENLGFAKGNNVGYIYAKRKLHAKYIVLLNNDVCMIQGDLYKKIEKSFEIDKFAVMGPTIITKDGLATSNPRMAEKITEQQISKLIKRHKILYKLTFLNLQSIIILFRKVKSLLIKKSPNCFCYMKVSNIILHGSFLIFSPIYINKFDGLEPRTFMYFEEDILYLRLVKNNMVSLYNPEITVYHKEDAATDSVISGKREKQLFVLKNTIDSLEVYKKCLKE
jgi:GT2 family glycosyltransferase